MQTLLAHDGPELVPVNVSTSAAALSDVLRDEIIDSIGEPIQLPSEFTAEATKAFVDYLELQSSRDRYAITRPLPESQPLDLTSAGVPGWAVEYIHSRFSRSRTQARAGQPQVPSDEALATHAAAANPGQTTDRGAHAPATPTDSDIDWPLLFNTLKLAQFLHAEALVELLAARIAGRIKAWTEGQREAVFAAVSRSNSLTPQERAAIRAENSWAEREPALEQQMRPRSGV